MNYQITETLKEEFYIKLYFDSSVDFDYKGIKRAYLDFSRTLYKKEESKEETDEERRKKRKETEDFLRDKLLVLISSPISSQDEFDESHKRLTDELIAFWPKLTIGQAQKWINMTLKYWLLFGGKRIQSIELNSMYFHIPIDMYVQTKMFKEKNPQPWSKIKDYEDYFKYQKRHRAKNGNNSPLLDEFIFFNNINKPTP